jgi:hypothetical protein
MAMNLDCINLESLRGEDVKIFDCLLEVHERAKESLFGSKKVRKSSQQPEESTVRIPKKNKL